MARHSIITCQAQNVELYGLDVQLDYTFIGCTLTSDNAGIINNGNMREDVEVVV